MNKIFTLWNFCIIVVVMLSYSCYSIKSRLPTQKSFFRSSKISMSSTIESLVTSPKVEIITHPSYSIIEQTYIKEYGLNAFLYKHLKTGAEVISVIAPEDNNKVFGINFRTPPTDSTGLPHVLEHSVLCGSRKFPVKEPFVDLLKGSLQNFLNAMTYPDRTCYPVASTNTKDFYNLVNVYLDAVLYPRAMNDPMVLQQEGWHYEIDGESKNLTIKGVVFNEMKGYYSSPDSLFGRATQQSLFPDNTYGVDSGGDPKDIPTLTYDTFQNFHSTYYHPSNSRVFFYGDDDPVKRLELLDEYLAGFNYKELNSKIKFQSKFMEPKQVSVKFPVDSSAASDLKHMISLNWVLNFEPLSMYEQLAIGVLDSLLVGTTTAALRKDLIQSNLGESFIGFGLSDDLLQATFSVGLKGVKAENVTLVEDLILTSLKSLSEKGFEVEAIDAALNTLEFRLREFNTGSYPRGLSLMLGMLPNWIYEKNPFDGIRFEEALKQLKADLASGKPIFQDLMKKYLIENSHRVKAEAIPDVDLESVRLKEERQKLDEIKASLTPEQIESIISSAEVLREAQLKEDSPEARATLPRLSLDDIDRKHTELPISVEKINVNGNDITVVSHDIQSNGILYADFAFDLSAVDFDELPYIPLFLRMLTEAGTSTMDEVTISRKIGAQTGGISSLFHTDIKSSHGVVTDGDEALLYLVVRGKATEEKVPVLLDLMKEILTDCKLDNKRRAIEMLRESKARKESSIITSGHSFAATRISSRHSFLGYLSEQLSGISSVRQASNLLQQADESWETIESKLKSIRSKIISQNSVVINLTASQSILNNIKSDLVSFVGSLPASTTTSGTTIQEEWKKQKANRLFPLQNEGFPVPSQVNYVVKGGQLLQPGEKIPGSFKVITRYLSNGYLWDNVRVVGGAYGAFAQFSGLTGRLTMASYRDPNLTKTLEIYDTTVEALIPEEVPQESLTETIIGTIGDIDSPLSPDQKGFSSFVEYLSNETPEDRQSIRDSILTTNTEDVKLFASKLPKFFSSASIATIGSQAALEQANTELATPLILESPFAKNSSSDSAAK